MRESDMPHAALMTADHCRPGRGILHIVEHHFVERLRTQRERWCLRAKTKQGMREQ